MDDVRYMRLALGQARRAGRLGEVPVGAIVVSEEGGILARGHNLMIARHDPTAHAEVIALRRAARRIRNYRLSGVTLYVTLEPCILCLGAIVQARVGRVVYAAADPKRGALQAARTPPVAGLLHHRFRVSAGVEADAASSLLREFFAPRRLAPPRRA